MSDLLTRCRNRLDYDPGTGRLTAKCNHFKHRRGSEVGYIGRDGYVEIKIDYRTYRGHRIIWLLMTGEFPPLGIDIDHKNGIRSDNRWLNLRLSDQSQQRMNNGLRSDNVTGVKGVTRRYDDKKWLARIQVRKQVILLGCFESFEDAVKARAEAERKYFGEFSSLERCPKCALS